MVKFVRVTYVRRGLEDSSETPCTATAADYWPPKGFSYKTFVPSPVKVAMCSGAPVYESFASTWERARVWLRLVGQFTKHIVGAVRWPFSHPVLCIKQVDQLSQRDRTEGWLVMAKSGSLELGYNIYGRYRSIFNHCDVIDQQNNRIWWIRAIMPYEVIQSHRGRYQSKARVRLPISD